MIPRLFREVGGTRPHGLVLLAVFFSACQVLAGTVRSKSDMRLWETVADRSVPLSWPWEGGADSATLVFSNFVTRAVSSATVARGAGEVRGSHAHPVAQPGIEALFGVSIVQKKGAEVVSRASAKLAYVSGAGGGPVVVRAKGTREWERIPEPRVFAFDPAWQGETGDSGYDVARPNVRSLSLILK